MILNSAIERYFTTGIGSLPFKDVDFSVNFHLEYLDIPCWPQLPKLRFYENMCVQFSEGLPGVVIEESNKKIYIKKNIEEKYLLDFFDHVVRNNFDYFKISTEYASGLYKFKWKIKEFLSSQNLEKLKYIKGQIIGPVSFGLSVRFEDGVASFYDSSWRDIISMHLKMKAIWQYEFLKELAENVIIFIDEPYLSSIGSGYLIISEQDIKESLSGIVEELKSRNVMVGIHCCGNTDWRKLADTEIDIINYDTYNYADSLLVLPDLISSHIEKNRYIAWGIVPSTFDIKDTGIEELKNRMDEIFYSLRNKGIDVEKVKERTLLTPSCGTGTLDKGSAFLVYKKLKELKQILNEDAENVK